VRFKLKRGSKMSKDSEFEKRIKSEQKATRPIRNSDLICKDCILRFDDSEILGNTSKCEMYDSKPNEIINGNGCPFHTVN
jgi:hypothetical protein